MMPITDSKLLAIEVGHQVDLIRLGSTLGANVNPYLNAISKKVREILLRTDTIDTVKLRDEIIKEVSAFMNKELGAFTDETEKDFKKVVAHEINFQADVIKGVVGKGVAVERPTVKDMLAVINKKPLVFSGKAFSVDEYIGDYTPTQIKAVKQVITGGWAEGLTTRQIAQNITGTKSVKGVIQKSQRSAYMLAKDVTAHISAQTKAEVFKVNDDLVVGEKIVVTLDSRTSDICKWYGSQDDGGKEYYYAKDWRNFPRPPFHPNCRTSTTPILADEYREISDEGQTRPSVIDGKAEKVPANTDWFQLAKENPVLAEQSLGKSKLKLLDNMTADEFVKTAYTRLGTPLTIEAMLANNQKVRDILL